MIVHLLWPEIKKKCFELCIKCFSGLRSKVNPLNDGRKATAWPKKVIFFTQHCTGIQKGILTLKMTLECLKPEHMLLKTSTLQKWYVQGTVIPISATYLFAEWYWSLAETPSGFRKKLEEQNHDKGTTEIAFYGENRLQPKIALMWSRVVYFTVNKGKTHKKKKNDSNTAPSIWNKMADISIRAHWFLQWKWSSSCLNWRCCIFWWKLNLMKVCFLRLLKSDLHFLTHNGVF